mgnify:CR=1 FL=1
MSSEALAAEIDKCIARLQLAEIEHQDNHRRTLGDCYCLPEEDKKMYLVGIKNMQTDLRKLQDSEREQQDNETAMGKFLRMTEQ